MLLGTAASGILVASPIVILAFRLAIRYFDLIAAWNRLASPNQGRNYRRALLFRC